MGDAFSAPFILSCRQFKKNGFLNNVTVKIELFPRTVFFLSTTISKEFNIKTKSVASFFSSFLSIFRFLVLFSEVFLSSFSLRLLVFFSVKRLQFFFSTFSKIQQDNALAFTVTYTLIFVNVPTSSNIQVSLFRSFSFSSC